MWSTECRIDFQKPLIIENLDLPFYSEYLEKPLWRIIIYEKTILCHAVPILKLYNNYLLEVAVAVLQYYLAECLYDEVSTGI